MTDFALQRAFLTADKHLVFENPKGMDQALMDGFFLVKTPEFIDLISGDRFAQNFYKEKQNSMDEEDVYRGFSIYTPDKFNAPHEGYYLREVDQTEQFFLEKAFWQKIYPPKLIILADQLNELAIDILKNVLRYVGVPEHIWPVATGECINNQGTHHLTFNHFRPEKTTRGLNVHKDSGWVTILRSLEPGLEACIDDQWRKINPQQGYFIVNFGCAMEILTAGLDKPVAAVTHRVTQQLLKEDKPDRFSYALFTDNSLDEQISTGLYAYTPQEGLHLKMIFRKFLDDILNATYQEDTVGLY